MGRMIEMAPGAEENGFASMMATLIQQNIEDHASKGEAFDRMVGRVAIVVEDLRIAVTLHFEGGRLNVLDGIAGIPDITIRAPAEIVMEMSLLETTTRFHLPDPRGEKVQRLARMLRRGEVKMHGALLNIALYARLADLLAVS